jgi:Ca2+-binding EF-hand superfamily protein
MGNTLNKTPTSPCNKTLLNQIRQRHLSDLLECYTVLTEDYPDAHDLDFSQFEDVFGPMLDDAEPVFLELQNNNDINGTVDIYETLSAFAVFVKAQFEKKVSFIFTLFDFDQTNSLETSELAITMQAAARGLCKFAHITPPAPKSLELEAKNVFIKIDLDNNKRIAYDEFMEWLRNNSELQDFILKHVGIQTLDNMKRRYEAIHSLFLHHFIRASGAHIGNEARIGISQEDLEFLFDVLQTNTAAFEDIESQQDQTLISRRAFEHVMKAWCSYSASDFNGDNTISTNELHAMLWLYEGEEPNDDRLRHEMRAIDKDGSGEIDRYEWMKHLCQTDKNGKNVFRTNLKVLFQRYDRDSSGYLSMDETKELVKEAFRDYLRKRSEEDKKKSLDDMIESLTKQIFEELDENNNTHLEWEEFKNYMNVSMNKIQKLKDFLDLNF